jgi:ATP-binding protein involved in chromosome partitioning
VADSLSISTGTSVPLLGQIPMDPDVRIGGDDGLPIVLAQPGSAAAAALSAVADQLAKRQTSLVGRSLGLAPAR